MKRIEKIALLTKVLQAGTGTSQINRQRLRHFIETAPRSLIIIDDLDDPNQAISDNDPVHFQDRGVEHRMTLSEANQYARRYGISTLIVLPAKLTKFG